MTVLALAAAGRVASWLALAWGAASTACAESGRDYRDGAVVLQVVANRAERGPRLGWRRYDGTLAGALWSPAQHAHRCAWPLTVQHLALGVAFASGTLDVPAWARSAWYYCGPHDAPGSCESRGARVIVGRIAHTYWAAPSPGRPAPRPAASESAVRAGQL